MMKEEVQLRFYANDVHNEEHAPVIDVFASFLQAAKSNKAGIMEMLDTKTDSEVYMICAIWENPLDGNEYFLPLAKLVDEDEGKQGRYKLPDLNGGWVDGNEQEATDSSVAAG